MDLALWQVEGEASKDRDGTLVVGGPQETRIKHVPEPGGYRLAFEYHMAGKDTAGVFLVSSDRGHGLDFPFRDKNWQPAVVTTTPDVARNNHAFVLFWKLSNGGSSTGRTIGAGTSPVVMFKVPPDVKLVLRNVKLAPLAPAPK
jgi:hypothetical protein